VAAHLCNTEHWWTVPGDNLSGTMLTAQSALEQLAARVEEQSLDVANLRAALALQFTRIAQMQAELDGLPSARRRRRFLLKLMAQTPSQLGDGRTEH
jgi:hypothetical protein